tara:strand:+ start:306 stop:1973 length:1668 start_codon:yes stop_codon:yes gene_type:complete
MNDLQLIQEALAKKQAEDRYATDFEAFAKDKLKILTKDKGWAPFILNDGQRVILEALLEQELATGKINAVILKARQMGISTFTAAFIYWKVFYGDSVRASMMAHQAMATQDIFRMTRNFILRHEDAPKESAFEQFNKGVIEFPRDHGGLYRTYTAKGRDAGRGSTQNLLHLTEVASFEHMDDIRKSLITATSQGPGSCILYESTAAGMNGFYELWRTAEKQTAAGNPEAIKPIFIPWSIEKEYRTTVWDGFELDDKEEAYRVKHNLDMEQMVWRANQIEEKGALDFQQEFPVSSEEAFIGTGTSVFDTAVLNKINVSGIISKEKFNLDVKTFEPNEFEAHLTVFRAPHYNERFVIGADVAQGGQAENADFSAAVILSENNEVVATYRARKVPPPDFAEVLYALGNRFNNAILAPENNSIGDGCARKLKELGYQNLYYRDEKNGIYNDENTLPGFNTNAATRPAIIGEMQTALRRNELQVNCVDLLDELKTFVISKSGKAEAASGCHDDLVMASCIAMEVLRTRRQQLSAGFDWNNAKRKWGMSGAYDEVKEVNWL